MLGQLSSARSSNEILIDPFRTNGLELLHTEQFGEHIIIQVARRTVIGLPPISVRTKVGAWTWREGWLIFKVWNDDPKGLE